MRAAPNPHLPCEAASRPPRIQRSAASTSCVHTSAALAPVQAQQLSASNGNKSTPGRLGARYIVHSPFLYSCPCSIPFSGLDKGTACSFTALHGRCAVVLWMPWWYSQQVHAECSQARELSWPHSRRVDVETETASGLQLSQVLTAGLA